METLKPILKGLPVFAGLPEEYYDLLVGCAKNERAKAGTFLFREDEEATKFFIVREGRVSIELHMPGRGPMTIQTISEEEVFGWSWVLPPYTWHFDARVVEDLRFVSFDAECLRKKFSGDPALGFELLKRFSNIMSKRIEALSLQLMDVYGDPASK